MQTIQMGDKTLHLEGNLPKVGEAIPDVTLSNFELQEIKLSSLYDKTLVIVTVPSLDTGTCQLEAKRFHKELGGRKDLSTVVVSLDLPFAQKRWCGAEGINNIHVLSDFKDHAFAKAFGIRIKELGLLARVVFVVESGGKLAYTQVVPILSEEPDYASVLAALP